jgi:hypothetical protein
VGSDVVSSAYYRNDEIDGFSEPANAGFLGDTVHSWSNAVGDFNRDNVLDIAVLNQAPFNSQLWENQGTGQFIGFQLTGVLSNRDGIGAKVELYGGQAGYQSAYTHCGSGFLAQQSRTIRFGLGNLAVVDSVSVTWPTGHRDLLTSPEVNTIHLLTEGATTNGDIEVDEDVLLTSSSSNYFNSPGPSLKISPNPVRKGEVVSLDQEMDELMIYSVTGRLISPKKLAVNSWQFSTRHLAKGTYFIVARARQGGWLRSLFLVE